MYKVASGQNKDDNFWHDIEQRGDCLDVGQCIPLKIDVAAGEGHGQGGVILTEEKRRRDIVAPDVDR